MNSIKSSQKKVDVIVKRGRKANPSKSIYHPVKPELRNAREARDRRRCRNYADLLGISREKMRLNRSLRMERLTELRRSLKALNVTTEKLLEEQPTTVAVELHMRILQFIAKEAMDELEYIGTVPGTAGELAKAKYNELLTLFS